MKLKNLNLRIFSLVLITGLILTSCKKDETPADNIVGTWTAGTPSLTVMVGTKTLAQYFMDELGLSATEAQVYVNQFNQMFVGSFSGTLTIKADGTYTANMGGSADSGTWSLSADGKKLTIDSASDVPSILDVAELTSSKLHLKITESSTEDLNGDGINETMTVSIDLTFTK
jgi:hypothetical protein